MSVTKYGIEKEPLRDLLGEARDGQSQLPDFQRGWIWDDDRVRSLLASISLGFPIGAVMMLETGGESVRFKQRPLEGAPLSPKRDANRLVLDGQQRLTSLFQSLFLDQPVETRDQRGKSIGRWYYIDMRSALDPSADREETMVSLPPDRQIKKFGRNTVEDYSTPELEYEAMLFPLSRVFDSMDWRRGFQQYWNYAEDKIRLWDEFEQNIVKRFEQYQVPVIELGKDTPKEAVCQVFEKVNTGGVTLTVFELLTATFAADNFELRKDWAQREQAIHAHSVLSGVSNTDFVQAVTLFATRARREAALRDHPDKERAPGIGCRRSDMLALRLEEYERWADPLVNGFKTAARFLHSQHLYDERFLPYGSQLIPLATILTVLGRDWESHRARTKLAQWYWCGVLGELYGGSTETRFSRDLPEVLTWIRGDGPEPRTVYDSQFAASRLLTLRTRRSAAYKGIYALLLREGARDWKTGEESSIAGYFDASIDIHHVFPQRWCKDRGIEPARCDSIVNKTPLAARTNRSIGGAAPSEYLDKITQGEVPRGTLAEYLQSHLITPEHLWADDFDNYFKTRQRALLRQIATVMGKQPSDPSLTGVLRFGRSVGARGLVFPLHRFWGGGTR
ncbi:GmrSD restriction endonuclease domain-containing protein [Candidatus Poriferisodalis sp.]|uniref:GmrSD restriction endonuclease domain-containing protein n=1 Tax=Candidatus Poriferisodalis sp. TaxID=3101277 RepID=UPI003B5C028E